MGRKATRTPWEKIKARRNYALSQRTIENLEYLITEKHFSSETEAIELAIEHLATEYHEKDRVKEKKVLEKEVGEETVTGLEPGERIPLPKLRPREKLVRKKEPLE